MDSSILQKVQNTLKTLIMENALGITDDVDSAIDVSFIAPNSKFISELGNKPVINCYLLQASLSDTRGRGGDPFSGSKLSPDKSTRTVQMAPKFIDLNYVMTVWSNDKKGSSEIEHLLLGYLISGLGKFEELPKELLDKHSIDIGTFQIAFKLFGNEDSKRLSETVWQLIKTEPKANIIVSLSVPISVNEEQRLPVVKEMQRTLERIN